MQKGQAPILIVVGLLILAVAIGGVFYLGRKTIKTQPQNPNQKACTMEAKICPDGSGVGRTGPNCEFAECPKVSDETANWKTYTDTKYGFSFMYPKSLEENYGAIVVGESDGDQGKIFGGSFSKNSYPTVFSFSGTTTDFAVGREETATIGFEKSDKRIYYKFYRNSLDITDSVIKTFFNNNGIEIVVFDRSALHPVFQGEIGAVINLKNATYPGIGFRIDPTRLDIKTFEKILTTFKFTN